MLLDRTQLVRLSHIEPAQGRMPAPGRILRGGHVLDVMRDQNCRRKRRQRRKSPCHGDRIEHDRIEATMRFDGFRHTAPAFEPEFRTGHGQPRAKRRCQPFGLE